MCADEARQQRGQQRQELLVERFELASADGLEERAQQREVVHHLSRQWCSKLGREVVDNLSQKWCSKLGREAVHHLSQQWCSKLGPRLSHVDSVVILS